MLTSGGLWFLKAGSTRKDQSEEDIEYFGLFHVLHHWVFHPIFPGLPFAGDFPTEALLIALHPRFNSWCTFLFLIPSPHTQTFLHCFSIPCRSPTLALTSCTLPFCIWVLSGTPLSSIQPSCDLCLTSCWEEPFLSLKEVIPENQPAGCLDSKVTKYIQESYKIYLPLTEELVIIHIFCSTRRLSSHISFHFVFCRVRQIRFGRDGDHIASVVFAVSVT